MEVTGEKVIVAPQVRVYDALHDPVILRQAIPGVQTLTKFGDGRYHITAALAVGSLRPTFTGTVEVYNEDRPAGYSLRGEAHAGAAGGVSGSAHVALAAVDADTTNLAYHVTADLGGEIGAIEDARIEPIARTLVAAFFARLQSVLDGEAVDADGLDDADAPAALARRGAGGTLPIPPAAADPLQLPGDARFDAATARWTAEASTADATGGPVPATADPLASTLPPTPYRPPYRTGYEATDRDMDDGRDAGVGRWVAAALGVVAIVLLLNDGFSGI